MSITFKHAGFALLVSAFSISAQEAQTDPVGFVSSTIPTGSDGTFGPAFHRPSVFQGQIDGLSGGNTVVPGGVVSWTADEFKDTHYILITTGSREGWFAEIIGNSGNQLTLGFLVGDMGSDPGDSVQIGDDFKIIPFWTLATLLPNGTIADGSFVFLYNRDQAGTNLSAQAIYRFYAGFGWYNGPTSGASQVIYPDESMLIRAPAGVALTLTQVGSVPMQNVRSVLTSNASGQAQDIRLASGVPVDVPIGQFFSPGAGGNGDFLLIYDDAAIGTNKSASMILTYYDGFGWYNGGTNMNAAVIKAGQGVIYRKAAANSQNVVPIQFTPSYLESQP